MTGFLSGMASSLGLRLSQTGRTSGSHSAFDRQAYAGDEARRVRAEEDDRIRHVGDLAESPERRLLDDRADRGFSARENADLHEVARKLQAHIGRHEPRIDAVYPYAIAELARFRRRDAGHTV